MAENETNCEENSTEKLIIINEEKCQGCGSCVNSCPNGGFRVINGKAHVVKENFCDGLGYCITRCPMGAISYKGQITQDTECFIQDKPQINNWPIKLHLVNPKLSHFDNTDVAIIADCVAPIIRNFDSIADDHTVLIYCPKIENTKQVREKMVKIINENDIKSITSYNVDFICCENLSRTVKDAIRFSKKKEILMPNYKHQTVCLFGMEK